MWKDNNKRIIDYDDSDGDMSLENVIRGRKSCGSFFHGVYKLKQ